MPGPNELLNSRQWTAEEMKELQCPELVRYSHTSFTPPAWPSTEVWLCWLTQLLQVSLALEQQQNAARVFAGHVNGKKRRALKATLEDLKYSASLVRASFHCM